MTNDKALEVAARTLVPVWYGGFEDQRQKEDGTGWLNPPGTPNARALKTAESVISAYLSALPGEAEVVAHAEFLSGKPTAVRLDKSRHCTEPLVTLASLQAMQARAEAAEEANKALMAERSNLIETKRQQIDTLTRRAEAAERERDEMIETANSYAHQAAKSEIALRDAEARVKELAEALEPFAFKGLRVDLDRFDDETGIDVHFPRTSPRKAIPIARIYVEDVLRARTALTGGPNG